MDLSPTRTESTPYDDKAWLDSTHGLDTTRTITLDVAGGTFAAVTTDNLIRSGTAVFRLGTGLYARVTDPATQKAAGHLVESVRVKAGTARAGAALLWHGVVVNAQVPGGALADAAKAPHVLYV